MYTYLYLVDTSKVIFFFKKKILSKSGRLVLVLIKSYHIEKALP